MPNPVGTGLPNPASYDTSSPGVVVDQVTGLTWSLHLGVTGTLADDVAFCAASGFRLPSILELVTLVDPTRDQPTANPVFAGLVSPFNTTDMDWFRSSTWATGWSTLGNSLSPDSAMWYLNFAYGSVEYWGVDGSGAGGTDNLLCVKGPTGPDFSPMCQYQVQPGGTVLDTNTGLTWQQAMPSAQTTLAAATTYCANNTAALPGTGWRVPSFNELMSLVDYFYALPAIEPTAFPDVPTGLQTVPFFTSSVAPGDAPFGDQAGPWLVDFMLGDGYAASPGGMAYVRCVR